MSQCAFSFSVSRSKIQVEKLSLEIVRIRLATRDPRNEKRSHAFLGYENNRYMDPFDPRMRKFLNIFSKWCVAESRLVMEFSGRGIEFSKSL